MTVITERIRSQSPGSFREHTLAADNLRDAVDLGIPAAKEPEDLDKQLREAASEAYVQALRDNPSLGPRPTIRARVGFMREALRLNETETGKLLGITPNQVLRKDFRARRKSEIGKFNQRLENGVAIANILTDESAGTVFNRRDALYFRYRKLTDFSISTALEAGFGNIAVSIALESLKHNQNVMGHQRED